MNKNEELKIPKAEFKGFTPEEEQRFVAIFKKALQDMEESGEVNIDLMMESSYPSQNLSNMVREGYKVNAEAYGVFNRFLRKAYELLFPSELLLTFEKHPLLEEASQISKTRLMKYLERKMYNNVDQYDIHLKRKLELAKLGTRADLPAQFYRDALKELQKGDNQLAERFVKYMGMLLLAAYDKDSTYRNQHHLEARDFETFLAPDSNKDGYVLREIIYQIVNDNPNFADLFAIFMHVEEKAKGSQIALRHYFLDTEGKAMVAKCGFADAFANHIADIVLEQKRPHPEG